MVNAGYAVFFSGNNSQEKFTSALLHCNSMGIEVNCSGLGDFAITGTEDILVKISVDFAGYTVDVSGWVGKFIIQDADDYDVFPSSSSLVQALVNSGTQSGAKLKGWENITDADDSYIRIMTSQPFSRIVEQ